MQIHTGADTWSPVIDTQISVPGYTRPRILLHQREDELLGNDGFGEFQAFAAPYMEEDA